MKLLIVTQKVDANDDLLGFFHDWLAKLAQQADLLVIANQVGIHNLPSNVTVYSLGKETGAGKIAKFFNYQRLLFQLLSKVDGVFFHMCPEYVAVAGFWPKIFHKKSLFWYTHKHVDIKLKLVEKLVDKIFTASGESFRLPSSKVEVAGHGIDLSKFTTSKRLSDNHGLEIISVSRIARSKNIHLLVEVASLLKQRGVNFKMKIAGAPSTPENKEYQAEIEQLIQVKELQGQIALIGKVPFKQVGDLYVQSDIFINLSDTGSIDKAVLEAMACGLKVLTSNEAFKTILAPQYFTEKEPAMIANKIMSLVKLPVDPALRTIVETNHNLNNVVAKIINYFSR